MKIIKIQTLEKGWCDKDYVLLHAAFQLLVDYVEQEKPQNVDWTWNPEPRHAWAEIRSLYRWWKKTRPKRKDPLMRRGLKRPPWRLKKIPGSELLQRVDYDKKKYAAYEAASKESCRLDEEWHKEDQRNLHRLIEIRPFLWT